MPSREQYIAHRIGARMQQRGEQMVLRRTTLSGGPVPYRNPPDFSSDLKVISAVTINGQAYLTIGGSSLIGRLVAGDQVLCSNTIGGPVVTTWTVGIGPPQLATDSDGVPLLHTVSHNDDFAPISFGFVEGNFVTPLQEPYAGTPILYSPDALAANDILPAVAVSAPGNPDPRLSEGFFVSFKFLADQTVYGTPLSLERMSAMGWREIDSMGIRLAAYNAGLVRPPRTDDIIFVHGHQRNILTVSEMFASGTQFSYVIQAR
jgi:hypothetical protein